MVFVPFVTFKRSGDHYVPLVSESIEGPVLLNIMSAIDIEKVFCMTNSVRYYPNSSGIWQAASNVRRI